MFVEIISPEKKLFAGEVKLIRVPGSKGSFEILDNHAPIISSLDKGSIKIIDVDDRISVFEVAGGILENKANKVVVLVEL
jgi:F-type H+-transporting ATPase subunit epsilon